MSVLSSELIQEFAKVLTPTAEPPKETTVYGTVVLDDGEMKVQFDGSSLYTPVEMAVQANEGDRVMVRLSGRTATVTGNMTVDKSPTKDLLKAVWVDSGPFDVTANSSRSIVIQVTAPAGYKLVGPMHVKTNGFVASFYVANYEPIADGESCWFTLYGMSFSTHTDVTASVLVLFAKIDAVAT